MRNAISRTLLLCAVFVLACVFAIENARAQNACAPLVDAQREVAEAGGGKLKPLSHEQLLFARGLFVATPPVSPYPPGDDAMIATAEDGSAAVVFVEAGKACGKMGVSPVVTKILLDIDKSI
jgi:hypothetical protein